MHQSAKSFHGRAAPPTQHVQEVGERVEYQLYALATLDGAASGVGDPSLVRSVSVLPYQGTHKSR